MSVPPKSDEDSSPPPDSATESAGAKRRPRARSRHYKTAKAKKADAAASDAPALALADTAPAERSPAPVPAPEPARESSARESAPVESPRAEEPAGNRRADDPPAPAPDSPSQPPPPGQPPSGSHADEGQGGGGTGGNGGGYYQQQQGQGKFGRRHRGNKFSRGNAKWVNPNAAPQKHPPQPPPPSAVVHYGDLPDPARFQDFAALETLAADVAATETGPIWLHELYKLSHAELVAKAKALGTTLEGVPNRKQLLTGIFKAISEQKIPLYDQGWLDLTDRGHGFVVHEAVNYRLYPEDSYLPEIFIRKFGLRRGHQLEV